MNVLAVFAHPDDEVLACGGTLARHAAEGDEVAAVTFTDGVTSRSVEYGAADRRLGEWREAVHTIGTRPLWWGRFADQELDIVPVLYLAMALCGLLKGFEPETVYTHFHGDLNADHRRVAEAVMVATRPFASSVRRVLACEVPESTAHGTVPFEPNVFVDISGQLLKKVEALRCYKSEKREPPHPRSEANVAAHAGVRGAQAGVEFAEAFMLLREVR